MLHVNRYWNQYFLWARCFMSYFGWVRSFQNFSKSDISQNIVCLLDAL